jgi:hypothetical protein
MSVETLRNCTSYALEEASMLKSGFLEEFGPASEDTTKHAISLREKLAKIQATLDADLLRAYQSAVDDMAQVLSRGERQLVIASVTAKRDLDDE